MKADETKGAAYEDKATTECRIVTDVDRFCGATRCKLLFFFCAEPVGQHAACDWRCNAYAKRAYRCGTEIAYRYGAAMFRSDVGCAHPFSSRRMQILPANE